MLAYRLPDFLDMRTYQLIMHQSGSSIAYTTVPSDHQGYAGLRPVPLTETKALFQCCHLDCLQHIAL